MSPKQGEERDAGGQINQEGLLGGGGAGAGSKYAYRSVCPTAELRALKTSVEER